MAKMRITGRLVSGLGEGASFTALDWARRQFIARLGIDPHPGTVNLALDDPADRAEWARLRAGPGIVLESPEPAWCNARCYRATIADGIEAAVVLPEVPGYPDDKVELIAAVGVRAALGIDDGDPVVVTFAAEEAR